MCIYVFFPTCKIKKSVKNKNKKKFDNYVDFSV